jgi:hypothetical protein
MEDYWIGNASPVWIMQAAYCLPREEAVIKFMVKNPVGIGYEGEWAVNVTACVKPLKNESNIEQKTIDLISRIVLEEIAHASGFYHSEDPSKDTTERNFLNKLAFQEKAQNT